MATLKVAIGLPLFGGYYNKELNSLIIKRLLMSSYTEVMNFLKMVVFLAYPVQHC